jgi:hypothetical protein
MRYVEEVNRASSEPMGRGTARSDRQRQQYLQKSAAELTAAACAGDPADAVKELARNYRVEKDPKLAETARMLRQACEALAQGKDPAAIAPVPG